MYALFILFAATMLFAHILACVWIWLGLHYEDGWINSLKSENYDGVWFEYGPYELYVFSLYWIFEVLSTVGYGDFSGSTNKEMLFTIFLEFGGLLLFSTMMALLIQLVTVGTTFEGMVSEYTEDVNVWVMKLEKANDSNKNAFMPPILFRSISKYTEEAFRHDHNLIVEQFPFYQLL